VIVSAGAAGLAAADMLRRERYDEPPDPGKSYARKSLTAEFPGSCAVGPRSFKACRDARPTDLLSGDWAW
jgi:hypothetical protein